MSIKVHANRELCQGAGQCVLSAPDVFDQDDQEGLVEVIQVQVGSDLSDAVRLAASRCPARVIRLEETS